ncbi:MAG: HTTM domain-containing protein, partial [Myxococcales bacterium]|nr:HTTM domain-containing protein [Myxococcales bacterium]
MSGAASEAPPPEPALERWVRAFTAPSPAAPVDRFRRLLGAWTAVYVALRLPYVEELYGRDVLNDAPIRRWFDVGPPPPELLLALMIALIVAALVGPWCRRARAASLLVALLFGAVASFETSPPRAYAALALIQWFLLSCAYGRAEADGGRATGWGARMLKLQYASVYLFAGLAKLCSPVWWGGAAIVYVLRSPDYGGLIVSTDVEVPAALALLFAWATILGEVFIAVGLWSERTRRWAILGVVALHLSLLLTIRISLLFHALMLLHLALFVRVPERTAARR